MERKVVVEGQIFSKELYDFLMTGFKESFAYSSLSVESAFERLEDCEAELNRLRNEHGYKYYRLLDQKDRRQIDAYLRRFIVFCGYQYGIIPGTFDVNCPQREVDALFGYHFKYMAEDMHYFLLFDSEGNFDQKATFAKIGEMFRLAFEKKVAKDTAYNMKKDHMDAFDYAISLKQIGIPEIIAINEKVNHTSPEIEKGFKSVNNVINGAHFQVSDKKIVPVEMQRLMAEYRDNFGLDIKYYKDPKISYKERKRRILKLCEREAIFHIRFERIHPFADGNGRTGRIIMNKHLIDEGLAPVLITDYNTESYQKCIESYDYEALAKIMADSSSQLLSNWVSMRMMGVKPRRVEQTNERLAAFSRDNKVKRMFLF